MARTLRDLACIAALLAASPLAGAAPLFAQSNAPAAAEPSAEDQTIATSLAEMLRAGRAVISANQDLINDASKGDKGLTGQTVLAATLTNYRTATGKDPAAIDPASRQGRLLKAQMDAIVEVVDANQQTINAPGVGFKAFIPAVFGRLVNEAFARRAQGEATIKVTAPIDLVRNRKSLPDAWEKQVIETKFLAPGWAKGKPFEAVADAGGHPAFRMMMPEYYARSCLSCHGEPKGSLDITGYPREGGKEGDLGSVISVTLTQ